PRSFGAAGQRLHAARKKAALSVQEKKRHDSNQRRQHDRKRDQSSQDPASRKLGALEEKRERNPDERRKDHGGDRDPETRPERLPLVAAAEKLFEMRERPVGPAQGFNERPEERVADEPGEQNGQRESRPESSRRHRGGRDCPRSCDSAHADSFG